MKNFKLFEIMVICVLVFSIAYILLFSAINQATPGFCAERSHLCILAAGPLLAVIVSILSYQSCKE